MGTKINVAVTISIVIKYVSKVQRHSHSFFMSCSLPLSLLLHKIVWEVGHVIAFFTMKVVKSASL